ncbi:MAG: T9SS C-terminal target domain-containing protein [Saprospirales bacterium]|nr:MAG: T9SS C-terminal target domain-containing protein [Saprospirales bacterium]
MNQKKIKSICICILIYFSCSNSVLIGQSSFVVSGGDISSGMGSISLSAGQLFYQPLEMGGYSLNPGVQQPYELFLVNVRELPFEGAISIFPNPALDFLSIRISDVLFTEKMHYRIIDITGREIQNGKVLNSEFFIKIDQLPAGSYYLVVGYSDKFFTPSIFLKL